MTSCHNKQMHVKFHCFSWAQAKNGKRKWGNLEGFNLIPLQKWTETVAI